MCPSTVDKSTEPCANLSSSFASTSLISSNISRSDTISSSFSSAVGDGKRKATSTFLHRSTLAQSSSNDYYTNKRIEHLHERMDEMQIVSFVQFLNYHLAAKYKPIEMKNLAKELANGHVWIDLIEILSAKKFKREIGTTRFHALTNVQYVLDYLKSRMQHVNISPHEIIAGNRKQILALLWIIMKTFDFPGFRLTSNRHFFSEQTLFGFGQDRSELLKWFNHLLEQSFHRQQIYIDDFYLQTWISTCYFNVLLKFLLPLSPNYLTEKSFSYLKQIDDQQRTKENRFQLSLDLSSFAFATTCKVDQHDKSEKTLMRFFSEFQLKICHCSKTAQIGKLAEKNPYIKQLIDTIARPMQTGMGEDQAMINHHEQYLICLRDEQQPISDEPRRAPINSIGHSSSSSSSDEEFVNRRTVEKSRSFQQQQIKNGKRQDRWNPSNQLSSESTFTNGHTDLPLPVNGHEELSLPNGELPLTAEKENDVELVVNHEPRDESVLETALAEERTIDANVVTPTEAEDVPLVQSEEPAEPSTTPSETADFSITTSTDLDASSAPVVEAPVQIVQDEVLDNETNPLVNVLEERPLSPPTEATVDEKDAVKTESFISSNIELSTIESFEAEPAVTSNQSVEQITWPTAVLDEPTSVLEESFPSSTIEETENGPTFVLDEQDLHDLPSTAIVIDDETSSTPTITTETKQDECSTESLVEPLDQTSLSPSTDLINDDHSSSGNPLANEPILEVLPRTEMITPVVMESNQSERSVSTVDQETKHCAMSNEPSASSLSQSIRQPVTSRKKKQYSAYSKPPSTVTEQRTVLQSNSNELQHDSNASTTKQAYSTVLKKKNPTPSAVHSSMQPVTATQEDQTVVAPPVKEVQPATAVAVDPPVSKKRSRRTKNKEQKTTPAPVQLPPEITLQDGEEEEEEEQVVPTTSMIVLETPSTKEQSPPRSRKQKKKKSATNNVMDKSSSTAMATAPTVANRTLFVLIKEYLRDPRMIMMKYVFILFCFCFALIILVVHQ